MAIKDHDDIEKTKRLMGALVRMPPKPHEDMKIGKSKQKPRKKLGKKPPDKLRLGRVLINPAL